MDDDAIRRGSARLMVRLHLSDLVRPDIGTEDEVVEAFARCTAIDPDVPLREVARTFRMTVNRMLLARACRAPRLTIRTIEG